MAHSLKVLVLLATAISLRGAPPPALMPLPAHVDYRPGELLIGNTFSIATNGYADARLRKAIDRFSNRLSRQTGIPFYKDSRPADLTIECAAAGPAYPTLGENETYQLSVNSHGARLAAPTTTGVLRGLETLLQLTGPGENGMRIPAVEIEDAPRFPWRGFMLDVSRHWMPLPVVLRNLDAMAAVKLNVFHWHLSDDQGFRMESKRYPKLQQLGSDGRFYTQEEARQVVEYARDRGIRVIPEFDVPGHASSWLTAYPELGSAPGPYAVARTWGVFPPTLDPTREELYTFLDKFITEMAAIFPDPDFHIGGDEVEDAQWKASPAIQEFEKAHGIADSHGLHAYFNTRLQRILAKHGKTFVGWDEVLDPGLAPTAIIQSWRGSSSLSDAARKGYRALLSGGYYLDYLKPAAEHYAVDPMDAEALTLKPEEFARILGGEGCMWTEYVSAETVDSRVWPRMAAIAERFWSPREVRDPQSMYERLALVSRNLDFTAIEHRTNFGRMVDRLGTGQGSEALATLAGVVEAQGIVGRRDERKYSSLIPLNRLVDIARPESEDIWNTTQAVQSFLASRTADDAVFLHEIFAAWIINPLQLKPMAAQNGLIAETLPVSQDLAAVGAIGAAALSFLQGKQHPPEGWLVSNKQLLREYEIPKAEVRLAAVRPVRLLVDALSGVANDGAQSPSR